MNEVSGYVKNLEKCLSPLRSFDKQESKEYSDALKNVLNYTNSILCSSNFNQHNINRLDFKDRNILFHALIILELFIKKDQCFGALANTFEIISFDSFRVLRVKLIQKCKNFNLVDDQFHNIVINVTLPNATNFGGVGAGARWSIVRKRDCRGIRRSQVWWNTVRCDGI